MAEAPAPDQVFARILDREALRNASQLRDLRAVGVTLWLAAVMVGGLLLDAPDFAAQIPWVSGYLVVSVALWLWQRGETRLSLLSGW